MFRPVVRNLLVVAAAGVLFGSGWLAGKEAALTQKTVIHAAAWSAKPNMSAQDFAKFKELSAGLIGQTPGLQRIWVGKLRAPITANGITRDHGVILEFDSVESKNAYSKDHPAEWYATFNSLRSPGSTNFDVVGE